MSPSTHLRRDEAAKHLNISVRTIDRYIRRGLLEAQRMDRHVLISQPSFERFFERYGAELGAQPMQAPTPPREKTTVGEALTAIPVETREETDWDDQTISETGTTSTRGDASGDSVARRGGHTPVSIYKGLYEELKGKHEEQLKRLEGAHYRVGQLEAQLKHMVPQLEVKRERQKLLAMDQQYRSSLQEAKVRVVKSQRLVESERLNRNVYVALVYGLLALQPIFWILLRP